MKQQRSQDDPYKIWIWKYHNIGKPINSDPDSHLVRLWEPPLAYAKTLGILQKFKDCRSCLIE